MTTRVSVSFLLHVMCLGLQERQPQTAYPMSITRAFINSKYHIGRVINFTQPTIDYFCQILINFQNLSSSYCWKYQTYWRNHLKYDDEIVVYWSVESTVHHFFSDLFIYSIWVPEWYFSPYFMKSTTIQWATEHYWR